MSKFKFRAALAVAAIGAAGVVLFLLPYRERAPAVEAVAERPTVAAPASEGAPSGPTTNKAASDSRVVADTEVTTAPGLPAPTSAPREPTDDEPMMARLVSDVGLNSSYAFKVVSSDFDTLLANLQAEGSPESIELEQLYESQIAAVIEGSDATLRRIRCGNRLCAAEVVRPLGTTSPDPFLSADINETLPRDARVEINFVDHDDIVRRFIFSIDPTVTSLTTLPKAIPPERRDR